MKKIYTLKNSDAIIITDMQVDFLPGGSLPVAHGDQLIPILNDYAVKFADAEAHVFASRDWHPPNHCSFKEQGGIWPAHCVQGTAGAQFHPDLKLPEGTVVISKATDPSKESYSAFDGTELKDELKTRGVKRFFIGGLATDYCVLNTVFDSLKLGFETVVLMDAVRGIDLKPGDVERAIEAMMKNGSEQATSDNFPEPVDALSLDETEADLLEENPSARNDMKKKARMRPRGSSKRIQTERKG